MKRIRLLVLLGAIAVALPLGLATANASGGSGGSSKPSVFIDQYADFDTSGTNVDVKLSVRCSGTSVANVLLEQSPPETGSPVAIGSGPQPLVACDGQYHSVGVTIFGAGYDVGWARATATVTTVGFGSTTVARSVYIKHV